MENVMKRTVEPAHKICPWWMGYLMDNPLRRRLEPLDGALEPYVRSGMTALDIGCGFGYYSIALAHLVGEDGTVVAVDVQAKMLEKAMARARKAAVADASVHGPCSKMAASMRVAVW